MLRTLRAEYRELARFYGEREARKLLPLGAAIDAIAVAWARFSRAANRHPIVSVSVMLLVVGVAATLLDA